MTHCKRCRRALKNEESLKRGYGPVCWSKRETNELSNYPVWTAAP